MSSSRRRFLVGLTGVFAGIAGCNERSSREIEETVTPVDVPRTKEELLREAASIETPSVPSPKVVSKAHHQTAIEHLKRLHGALTDRLGARDEPPDFEEYFGLPDEAETVVENVEERLAAAREMGPSREAVNTARRGIEEAAIAVGYLRTEAGDLDAATLRDGLDEEQAAIETLRDTLEYRLAAPIEASLPAAFVAEETLQRLDDPQRVSERIEDAESYEKRRRRHNLASVYSRLERLRRRRDDVSWYLRKATNVEAPPRRGRIDAERDAIREELATFVERASTETETRGETAVGNIRRIRSNAVERCKRTLEDLPESSEDGRRIRGLLEATRRAIEYEAIDAAATTTLEALDGESFPEETLPDEKRRAVQNLQRAAEAAPLQRQLTATAVRILSSAERVRDDESVEQRRLVRTYFIYNVAREWVDLAFERGDALADTL